MSSFDNCKPRSICTLCVNRSKHCLWHDLRWYKQRNSHWSKYLPTYWVQIV